MKQRENKSFTSARCLPAYVSAFAAAFLAMCAVLASLPAAAQTSRKAGGIVDPVYREPVYAPKRVVTPVAKSKAKRTGGPLRAKTAPVAVAAKSIVPVKSTAAPQGSKPPAMAAAVTAGALAAAAASTAPPENAATAAPATPDEKTAAAGVAGLPMTMEQFLDRLMIAESGGRLDAKNPRSTALGPFQFIESTFLAVAKRNFAAETANLSNEQILALRTDMAFARKAAEAYTRENAAVLKSYDVEPTYPNLRLAFLLGAGGAAKVLKAPPLQMLQTLLSPAVLIANPFMASMTASGLAARSAREVWQPVNSTQGVMVPPGTALPRRVTLPSVPVQCNIRLPSCKRWLALETAKLRAKGKGVPATKVANASRQTGQEISNTLSRLGGPQAVAPAAKR